MPPTQRAPATETFEVVEALVKEVLPVTPRVLAMVTAPCVSKFPVVAVVVALPPTQRLPATETAPEVEAVVREERPVTESVPSV